MAMVVGRINAGLRTHSLERIALDAEMETEAWWSRSETGVGLRVMCSGGGVTQSHSPVWSIGPFIGPFVWSNRSFTHPTVSNPPATSTPTLFQRRLSPPMT